MQCLRISTSYLWKKWSLQKKVLFSIVTSVLSLWTLTDTALQMNKTGKSQHFFSSILVLVLDEFSVRQITSPHNSVTSSDEWPQSDLQKISFLKSYLLSLKLVGNNLRWVGLPQNQVGPHSNKLLSCLIMFLFKFDCSNSSVQYCSILQDSCCLRWNAYIMFSQSRDRAVEKGTGCTETSFLTIPLALLKRGKMQTDGWWVKTRTA